MLIYVLIPSSSYLILLLAVIRASLIPTTASLEHPGFLSAGSIKNSSTRDDDPNTKINLTFESEQVKYVNKYSWSGDGFPNTRNASLYPDEIPEGIQSMFYTIRKKTVSAGQVRMMRKKRQVDFPLHNIQPGSHVVGSRYDTLPTCPPAFRKSEMEENPLKCYQCNSDSTDVEPKCSDELWRYLSPGEKYEFSIRCPANRGHYCAKSVSVKSDGGTVTIRGCMGPGPLETNLGRPVKLKEGCLYFQDDTLVTVTCFCKSELCNSSISIIGRANILKLFIIIGLLYFKVWN